MKFLFLNKLDSHAREILSKGAVAFILKIVGAGLAFLLQIAVARYLGASGAGLYFLALTIITLVATVARLGMDFSVVRFVAAQASENDWSKIKGVVRHAMRIALAVSLIATAAVFFLSDRLATDLFRKPELATPLKWMSLVIAPLATMMLYSSALQGLKRVRDAMLMQSVLTPLLAGVALYWLAPLFGISGAASAYGIGVMLTLVYGFWVWQRAKAPGKLSPPHFSANVLLTSSVTLLGAAFLQQIMQALPLLLLGVWGSSTDVGLFSTAQRTAGQVSLVLIAANIIVAPKIAELYQQKDMAALGKVASHGALLMTAMAAPALLLFLIAPQRVMGIFGAEFSAGWLMLVIMALGQSVNVATGSVGFLLVMTGHEKQLMSALVLSTVLNFILCIGLIPFFGGEGAALAASISLASVNLLRVRFVWKSLHILALPFPQIRIGRSVSINN